MSLQLRFSDTCSSPCRARLVLHAQLFSPLSTLNSPQLSIGAVESDTQGRSFTSRDLWFQLFHWSDTFQTGTTRVHVTTLCLSSVSSRSSRNQPGLPTPHFCRDSPQLVDLNGRLSGFRCDSRPFLVSLVPSTLFSQFFLPKTGRTDGIGSLSTSYFFLRLKLDEPSSARRLGAVCGWLQEPARCADDALDAENACPVTHFGILIARPTLVFRIVPRSWEGARHTPEHPGVASRRKKSTSFPCVETPRNRLKKPSVPLL